MGTKNIVDYINHTNNSNAPTIGDTFKRLVEYPMKVIPTLTGAGPIGQVESMFKHLLSGKTANGAMSAAGMTHVPNAIMNGAIQGVVNKAEAGSGINARYAQVLGNPSMRLLVGKSGRGMVHSPLVFDALNGASHPLAASLGSRGGVAGWRGGASRAMPVTGAAAGFSNPQPGGGQAAGL